MWPQNFWWGGMWIFPIIMLVVVLIVIYLIFGRGGRPLWYDTDRHYSEGKESETALEILKKRYARGEITKEEFEQMKKDILS